MRSNVVRSAEFPHGIRCARCHREMYDGEHYSEMPEAFVGDIPVVLLVCAPCGLEEEK